MTDRQYHVQGNAGVSNQDVRIICNTNQFTSLPFYGPHYKPHDSRGMRKHYHFLLDPKLGNGVCTILNIPCACVACTSMLDKSWMSGIPSYEQEHYKPATTTSHIKRV